MAAKISLRISRVRTTADPKASDSTSPPACKASAVIADITARGVARKAARHNVLLYISGATPAVRKSLTSHGVKPPAAHFERSIEDAKRFGLIRQTFEFEPWVDRRFLDEVLKEEKLEDFWTPAPPSS